ncbi:hypothetical protein ACFQE1_13990 [Halobium palmae]|uniref:Sporulation protein YjcZ n=1 Tax=Halobium palmae TaxID=1776492 RepID=A0ABD5S1A6_9EURY
MDGPLAPQHEPHGNETNGSGLFLLVLLLFLVAAFVAALAFV